jgi:hypothetical protein
MCNGRRLYPGHKGCRRRGRPRKGLQRFIRGPADLVFLEAYNMLFASLISNRSFAVRHDGRALSLSTARERRW